MEKNEDSEISNNIKNNDENQIKHSKTNMINFYKPKNQFQVISEVDNKRKSLKTKLNKKSISTQIISKEDVFNFLSKLPNLRSSQEIRLYARYLSQNYQYFTKLKDEDSQLKVEKLTKVCKLEKTMKGDSIINFGEIGDKFYIVLEGIVEIYKPKYVEVALTPGDFINTLNIIRRLDGNDLRYNRIKSKNMTFFDSVAEKENMNVLIDYNYMKYKQVFIMEEEEKLGEFGEGFSFGDIALIKKTVRNATIKAKENCILLTIDKDDYNKALLEFQKKKLSKDIEVFIKTYSFFKNFSHDRIISLFNCFKKKELLKGEYLYKQNEEDELLYFINNGTFSIYSLISFSWANDYINYINYSGKNILQFILKKKDRKIAEILKVIQECKSKMINYEPIYKEKYDLWEKINDKDMKDNLYKLKKDEEKLNDPEYIFKIDLKNINSSEILGLEEVFEFKKRFCNCICTSDRAIVNSIKLTEFLKLIIHFGEDEIKYFINMIDERKKVLKTRIIKGIKNIEKKLIYNFDMRYDNIIKKSSNCEKDANNKEKINMLFSTMKMKGYKNNLNGILDNDIPLLEKEENKNESNNYRKLKKNRSIEGIISSYGLKKKSNNDFKLKVIKNILSKKSKQSLEDKKNYNIRKFYDLLNKTQIKNINDISNYTNSRYNNKLTSNSYINKSTNCNSSFKTELKKKKNLIYNNIKTNNLKYIYNKCSNDKSNISSNDSKSPKIKIIKFKQNDQNYKLTSNISMPNFKGKTYRRQSIRDSITTNETVNFPKLSYKHYFKKTNSNRSLNLDKLYIKDNNDYYKFYNFYNEDKNFFLGVEFLKKLKKDYTFRKNDKELNKYHI